MFKLFRKIRQQLLIENKFRKYMVYALGEIILVVIGILIALQVNNLNDLRNTRVKELNYLQNIKNDLEINILELNKYIDTRTELIKSSQRILEHFEGKPVTDLSAFNADGVNIYNWQKFYQSNNTFQELINSGNLGIISNDSIKSLLFDIESAYKKIKSEEEHYRFDTETLIYIPMYNIIDLKPMLDNYIDYVSNSNIDKKNILPKTYYDEFLTNIKLKNGFVMTVLEFGTMNEQMQGMITLSKKLIVLIDIESKSNSS